MTKVLALRLGGPLQSWGSAQRLDDWRRTEHVPTKSAVVGLVAAALGLRRDADPRVLAALRFGVRSDRAGERLEDFHTVSSLFDDNARLSPGRGRLPKASGGYLSADVSTKITRRHYLADACFVAALEGDEETVVSADLALRRPVYPPYLGRRSCPPDRPIALGVFDGSLEEVLGSMPWQATRRLGDPAEVSCEVIVEDPEGELISMDQPLSFHPIGRAYARRMAHSFTVTLYDPAAEDRGPGKHDPFEFLEE